MKHTVILLAVVGMATAITSSTAQSNQWDQLKGWITDPPESFRMVVERSYYRGTEEPYHVGTTVIIKHGQQRAAILTFGAPTAENLQGRLDGKGKAGLVSEHGASIIEAIRNPIEGWWDVSVLDDPLTPAAENRGAARILLANADMYRTFGLALAGTKPETINQVGQTLFADDRQPEGMTLRADLQITNGKLTGFHSVRSDKRQTDCTLHYDSTRIGIPDWMPVRTEMHLSTGLRIVTEVKLYLEPHKPLDQEIHILDLKGCELATVGGPVDLQIIQKDNEDGTPGPRFIFPIP